MKTRIIGHWWKKSSIKQKLITLGILALLSIGALGAMGEFSSEKKSGLLSGLAESVGLKAKSSRTGDSVSETLTPPNGTLQLSKEYVYAGSRMLATEDYGVMPNSSPTPITLTPPVSGNYYQIIAKHTNKCANVSPNGTATLQDNGAIVQQWDCLGQQQTNQLWKFTQVGDAWEIRAAHSNKCMDVWAASQDLGIHVQQYACHGGLNQQWKLVPVGDAWQLIAKHSNQCLDVMGASLNNGANTDQWTCGTAQHTNQLWKLNLMSAPPKPDLVITSFTATPANPSAGNSVTFTITFTNQGNAPTTNSWIGVYYLVNGVGQNVWAGSTTTVAPGQSVTYSGTNQPWTAIAGNHTITAILDDQSSIDESNESNNTSQLNLSVGN